MEVKGAGRSRSAYLWYDDAQGADNENYASAKELAEAVKEQLELSVVKGQALKFTEAEARQKYGDSMVVALGAQVKNRAKETGNLTVRLLFDGTHGVPVNAGIRVRDQDKVSSSTRSQTSSPPAREPQRAKVRTQGGRQRHTDLSRSSRAIGICWLVGANWAKKSTSTKRARSVQQAQRIGEVVWPQWLCAELTTCSGGIWQRGSSWSLMIWL